ncbi:alpha/beta-hydrolase [Sarocladium strictum]
MASSVRLADLAFTQCRYGENHRQRLGVWVPKHSDAAPRSNDQQASPGYWIVFIHGGGWRDPRNTYEDFKPSIEAVLASKDISASSIRGFASLDYRLSPHPEFPQDPVDTPAVNLRAAKHPDHILDVRAALAYLDKHYGMGQDYILLGHSAGATLTYQLLMGEEALAGHPIVPAPLPRVTVGISGVYDLPGLVARGEGLYDGIYRKFVTGAFGSDEEAWKKPSPVNFSGKYTWPGGKVAILAWSPEDTLIDEPEIDCLIRKMKSDGNPMAVFKDLSGDHEVVWEQGDQVARLVAEALSHLKD